MNLQYHCRRRRTILPVATKCWAVAFKKKILSVREILHVLQRHLNKASPCQLLASISLYAIQ